MIKFTSDPNCINNIIYDTIINGGSEILKTPYSNEIEHNPVEVLDACIQFFADLDSEDGYIKCSGLLKIKEKFISEEK